MGFAPRKESSQIPLYLYRSMPTSFYTKTVGSQTFFLDFSLSAGGFLRIMDQRCDLTVPYIKRGCQGVDNPAIKGKTKGLET